MTSESGPSSQRPRDCKTCGGWGYTGPLHLLPDACRNCWGTGREPVPASVYITDVTTPGASSDE